MIRELTYIRSKQHNPYLNLALEEHLLENVDEDECILYLWQNEKTVVFGRNQNPWKECKINELKNDGGHPVRRLSGGGAVFHDLGNLNFTFLVRKPHYDVNKQLEVIVRALKNLGIQAEKSGRNDITVNDRKFSGNAFYKDGKYCYHHGTILVDVNKKELSKYLNVSAEKLKSKGVNSVKSRITNLKEHRQDLSIDMMCEELVKAFSQVYNLRTNEILPADIEKKELERRRGFFESWDWIYGKNIPFVYETYKRFPWGSFHMQVNTNKGKITDCRIYSDAMDIDVISKISEVLIGVIFSSKDIVKAIHNHIEDGHWVNLSQIQKEMLEDICQYIMEEGMT